MGCKERCFIIAMSGTAEKVATDIYSFENLRRQGTAVVYVGHYMEEVERISTHICVMDGGKCRAFGSKEELLETSEGRITLAELYTRLCGQQ